MTVMDAVDGALAQLATEAEVRRAGGLIAEHTHRCPWWRRPSNVTPEQGAVQCVLWRDHFWSDHIGITPTARGPEAARWGSSWAFIPEDQP